MPNMHMCHGLAKGSTMQLGATALQHVAAMHMYVYVFAGPANTLSSSCCAHVGVVTTLMWSTLACMVGVDATAALAEHPGWISF